MSGLPYVRDNSGDPSAIPLHQLRTPAVYSSNRLDAQRSTEDLGPPVHHTHPHGFETKHYYQGIDPGYQADADAEEELEDDEAYASGSGSHGKTYNTYNQDTLVSGEKQKYFSNQEKESGQSVPESQHRKNNPQHHHHHHEGEPSESETETDDFDWNTSDEDDDEADKEDEMKKRIRAKRGRKIYLWFMRLARPVRVFTIGLIGTAIALVPFIVVLAAFKSKPVAGQVEVWSIWIAIIWASTCGTFLVLDWLPPIILKMGVAFYGKAPELFKTYVETLIAILFWIKLVLCISWAWISLGGVLAIQYSSSNRPPYFRYIFLVLQALFGTSMVILAENFLLQLIAINFHKTALKDRLENNKAAIKALDALRDSKYLASGNNSRRNTGQWGRVFGIGSGSKPSSPGPNTPGGRSGTHAAKTSKDGIAGYFHQSSKGSPNDGKREVPTPANEKDARKANFANQLSDALATATMKNSRLYRGKQGNSQLSARRLAKKLFMAIGHHRHTLAAEDFYPFFSTPEKAQEAFKHFDADNNGDISKLEMRDAVQRIYRERRALTTSLKDMSSAVSKLDGVLFGVALVIIVFIWLLIFNGNSTVENIAPLSTIVVSFSFVFGNSAKTLFESMVFIFATHPYDVGDLVCVDDNFMFVTSFGLISTTFRTVVNEYIVVPNSLLASSKMIFNCRRSGNQWEVTNIQVGYDSTLMQMIDELRSRMRAWVKARDREWGGGLEININELETQANSVDCIIAFEHKGNWQNWGDRWARRTQLMRQVKTVCEELGIKYSLPVQPVTFHPRKGPDAHIPRGPNVPPSLSSSATTPRGNTPLPVGGIGKRQYTKAELADIKKASSKK